MNPQPGAIEISETMKRRLVLGALAVLAVIICLTRYHFYDEPVEWDITAYYIIGSEMMQGHSLYSDLWDHKPPGMYIPFSLAYLLIHDGVLSVYLLGVTAAVLTLLGVYAAASSVGRGKAAGLWAALFWTVISGDIYIQANQPNSEAFINVLLIWSLAFLLMDQGKGAGHRLAVGVGIVWAMASLIKPNIIFYCALLACGHIWFPPGASQDRARAVRQILITVGVGIAFWMATIGYFYITSRFNDFWELVVDLNAFYATRNPISFWARLASAKIFPPYLYYVLPILALTAAGFLLGPFKKPSRSAVLIIAYVLATPLVIAGTGWFYPHYYQLWLPLMAVLGGWAIYRVGLRFKSKPIMVSWVGAAAVTFLVIIQTPYYKISLDGVSWIKYNHKFTDARRVAEKINDILLPDETLFLWGAETQFYFYPEKRPPEGIFSSWLYTQHPVGKKLSKKVLEKISNNLPELFVATPYSPENHPLLKFFIPKYAPIPNNGKYHPYLLLYLKGGKLEERLMKKAGKI